MTKWNFTQEFKVSLTYKNELALICNIHTMNARIHMIISTETMKAYDIFQHPFMIQIINILEIKGNFLKL